MLVVRSVYGIKHAPVIPKIVVGTSEEWCREQLADPGFAWKIANKMMYVKRVYWSFTEFVICTAVCNSVYSKLIFSFLWMWGVMCRATVARVGRFQSPAMLKGSGQSRRRNWCLSLSKVTCCVQVPIKVIPIMYLWYQINVCHYSGWYIDFLHVLICRCYSCNVATITGCISDIHVL